MAAIPAAGGLSPGAC